MPTRNPRANILCDVSTKTEYPQFAETKRVFTRNLDLNVRLNSGTPSSMSMDSAHGQDPCQYNGSVTRNGKFLVTRSIGRTEPSKYVRIRRLGF